MIVVTGTKRSGTSMWMQALGAAGLPVLGSAFPRRWRDSIGEANPRGFYESRLRAGIYYRTNPDPKTGAYLHPQATRHHAAKVFIPGLIRTDHAFLHRVIATVRPWREYRASLLRLYALEDAWLAERPLREGEGPEARAEAARRARAARGSLPLPVEWWFEVYDLIRDVATRRYPVHVTTYARVLARPEAELTKVLDWVGRGEAEAAAAVIEGGLRSQQVDEGEGDEALEEGEVSVMDAVYAELHDRSKLPRSLLADMNRVQARLEERYRGRARRDDALDVPAGSEADGAPAEPVEPS